MLSEFESVLLPGKGSGSHASAPRPWPAGDISMEKDATSTFESIPAEIIDHILYFLPPESLATLQQTCRLFRSRGQSDIFWKRFVLESLPPETVCSSPAPAKTWKDLFACHHPYWFLTRHQFWFSDSPHAGSILFAKYFPRAGCIEAYRVLARPQGHFDVKRWEYDRSVHIHSFDPEVTIIADDPVVQFEFSSQPRAPRLSCEVEMQTGQPPGISSLISMCKPIPRHLQDPSMALWPPPTIPAVQRVRNQSASGFSSLGHRPERLSEASDQSFRLRKCTSWMRKFQPFSSLRLGDQTFTFSALNEKLRRPTKQKPYQGLWVGDYSAHGCEFLLVRQVSSRKRLHMSQSPVTDALPAGQSIVFDWDDRNIDESAGAKDVELQEYAPSGRIEAIKLTGDINVPRGECTWFADDLGDAGLVRTVEEETFQGSRIVRGMGHIALRNFQDDRYIETQLIMISPDTLALYWEAFGHISMYRRFTSIQEHSSTFPNPVI